MNNLFSIFDPCTPWFGLSTSLNWLAAITCLILITPNYWKILRKPAKLFYRILTRLEQEISTNLGATPRPGLSHFIVRLFLFIRLNNYLGLSPYTFTRTRHLVFTVVLALTLWIRIVVIIILKDISHTLAHLVPLGTPYPLIPLIVMIEIIRNLIRPLTLSVRLAANIVAGHLLLTLISGALNISNLRILRLGLVALSLLMVLENAVALIQAYVFRILPSLYLREINNCKVNYLNNFINLSRRDNNSLKVQLCLWH